MAREKAISQQQKHKTIDRIVSNSPLEDDNTNSTNQQSIQRQQNNPLQQNNHNNSPTYDKITKEYTSLRPRKLSEFIGQSNLKENLRIFLDAAKMREENPDHILFYGPPGLGKTTLSQIIANELEVNIRSTSGPILSKAGDLAAILANIKEKEVLFIDEIHRLNSAVEEVLYSAMEDFSVDLIIGEGAMARTMKINIPKFTLVGATTRIGMLTNPLKDRFGIPLKLDFYSIPELEEVVMQCAHSLMEKITKESALEVAKRARGTPRIAIRLLKRIRDFAHFHKHKTISKELVCNSLERLGVDGMGLDELDYKYLRYISENYKGGPVGIETIAAGLFEDKETIETVIEPYLMQIGFVSRTARGRELTITAIKYLQKNLRI